MSKNFLDHIRLNSHKRSHLLHSKRSDKNYLRKWKVADEINFPEEAEHLVSIQNDSATGDNSETLDPQSYNVRQRSKQTSATDNECFGNQNCAVAETTLKNNKSRIVDPYHNCEFAILDIEDGETLQSLSLKFHCSVSDLKRANNLISNQEFYALRQLKVPIKKHGMFTEKIPFVQKDKSVHQLVPDNNHVKTVNVGIGPMVPGGSKEDAIAFFRKMDEDLVKIMLSTKSQKDSLEAATVALTSPRIQPLFKENTYSGVDCGIQWCSLVIFMIIIGLILPIAVIMYMYSRPPSELSNHTYDNAYTVTVSSFTGPPVKGKS